MTSKSENSQSKSDFTPHVLGLILDVALENRASDIHLKSGVPPVLRVDGRLKVISSMSPVKGAELIHTFESMITPSQKSHLAVHHELDAALMFEGKTRVRLNIYQDISGFGCAMRLIPIAVPSIQDLALPAVIERLTDVKAGLVLVTGATGTGKSTTLAAMVDAINIRQASHIYTIEDPVEFVHRSSRSIITQVEMATNNQNFAAAARAALRADPNVLLIGEMRDQETIATALAAAETGLLVFSTLHTGSAIRTIQRILGFFEPREQDAVRTQLAYALRAVICQQLLPLVDGGRRAFHEVMVNTATIEESILRGDFDKIGEYMRNGSYDGMCTMDDSIFQAYTHGEIEGETAKSFAIDREQMERALRGAMLS